MSEVVIKISMEQSHKLCVADITTVGATAASYDDKMIYQAGVGGRDCARTAPTSTTTTTSKSHDDSFNNDIASIAALPTRLRFTNEDTNRPRTTIYKTTGSRGPRIHFWVALYLFKVVPKSKIFSRLKQRLEQTTVKKLDRLLTIRTRVVKWVEKRDWLNRCLRDDVFPSMILTRLQHPSPVTGRRLMKEKIQEWEKNLQLCRYEVTELTSILTKLDLYTFLIFQKHSQYLCNKVRIEARAKLLLTNTDSIYDNNDSTQNFNNVINLSNYELTYNHNFALSFGLKFCIPPKKINPVLLKAQFESLYNQLSELTPSNQINDALLRSRLVVLTNEISKIKFSNAISPLTSAHLNAAKQIAKNRDLIVSRADKGNCVVILNRSDYVTKMANVLANGTRFIVDPKQEDASMKALADIKKTIKDLTSNNMITEHMAKKLVPTAAIVPRLYGLPKIHKKDVPLRPILSMVGSAHHPLAKFLAHILEPVQAFYCKRCLTDLFDLVDKLNKTNGYEHNSYCLGSLDIVALFTAVPVKKCIEVILDTIENNSIEVKIEGPILGRLLHQCVSNIQFLFNNTYYRQIDGVAMGSPLGPVLANIYVGYIEYNTPNIDTDTILYGRYVDDVIVLGSDRDAIHQLCNRLNSIDNNIQFTVELESNMSLPYLDVRIHRDDHNKLKFSWYHKDTWSGRFLHYKSFVPMAWKTGLLKGYKTRLLRICSPEFLKPAIEELSHIFKMNGYPCSMIKSFFQDYIPPSNGKNNKTSTVSRKPVFIYLPFLGDRLSDQIAGRIDRYVRSAYPQTHTIVRWKPTTAFHFPVKDKLPNLTIPNVVYHFRCPCTTNDYIGRTEQPLGERINQHLPKWLIEGKKHGPRSDKKPSSAIARHRLECNVPTEDIKNCFKIVHNINNTVLLRILEALEIKYRQPTLCIQKDRLFDLKIPWL